MTRKFFNFKFIFLNGMRKIHSPLLLIVRVIFYKIQYLFGGYYEKNDL